MNNAERHNAVVGWVMDQLQAGQEIDIGEMSSRFPDITSDQIDAIMIDVRDRLAEWIAIERDEVKKLERIKTLMAGEHEDATVGEVAARKARLGDSLAIELLRQFEAER